jgi:predicted nucleotidyltransferase
MVRSVNEAFNVMRSNLEITQLQQEAVSARQRSIREHIQKNMNVTDDFLIGSYARHTLIGPLSEADVDILVVLDPSYYHEVNTKTDPQARLLDKVRSVLCDKYPTTTVSRNGQAVTIKFSDYYVDVVPGFLTTNGNYFIPDSATKRWIYTNPKKHNEAMAQTNVKRDKSFVPLIKMVKAWNRNNGGIFSSFHLEVMGANLFDNVSIADFQNGLLTYFDQGVYRITQRCMDPAGFDDNLGTYLSIGDKMQQAPRLFEKARNHARNAISHERIWRPDLAIAEWKQVFGACYPSYG